MRKFGIISPQFWIGETGRHLRECGTDVQTMALYLMTSPHAHMCGLYYLPLTTAAHEIGLLAKLMKKPLDILEKESFAFYDAVTEFVWVKEMSHWQVGLLKLTDNRLHGIQRWYDSLSANPYLGLFFDRYSEELHLLSRREANQKNAKELGNVGSPSEGASKGLRRGFEGASKGLRRGSEAPIVSVSSLGSLSCSGERGLGEGGLPLALGEFHHVLLSPDDLSDLQARFPQLLDSLITELDLYGEIHPGKFAKYKNHKAVLITWAGRREKEKSNGQRRQDYETKGEALIRKQKEQSQRFRRAFRGSTGDGLWSSDSDGADGDVRSGLERSN